MIDVYVDIDDSFIAAGAWSPNGSYTKGDRVYDNSRRYNDKSDNSPC